ncbi:SpoIVB peptidase S55 domain-containing protein [Granulicella arctica]|uniref:SpoIVB peptidase S55 domain-containing protein n=1 Tax=Granulicella arctica TaxID=940613 RepID=UPI0021DF8FB9|nr:SpoIVB peptidase S55 domain-containing protein [Granulicella arctica]
MPVGVAILWTFVSAATSSGAQSPNDGPPKETRFFPLAEIKRGQMGVAYTVFEGVLPEPMQVEILGVLKDSLGPGRDMILARLHGTKPEYTGVVAGMSGSPVYIDGRLVGALSYRIGQFSKEPIAGITPIAEMLDVRDIPAGPRPKVDGQPEMQAMETPLMFSGFSQQTVDLFGDRFRALGLTPVAGLGGADAETKQPEPLIPGSAVSAILVRGDLSVSGTCTVTYVDTTRLLACGHPITQNGPVSMPMTKATVVATLPSPMNAFKIVNTTETVGSFTEDRASAILGRFGIAARMIPAVVEVVNAGSTKVFHFEVLDDRQLTPSAMLSSVYQTMQGTNAAAAEQSYLLTGELTVAGQPGVRLLGMMAPTGQNTGAITTALYINDRFSKIYENAVNQPVVTGLKLRLEVQPARRTAVVEAARLSKVEARAGETIEVEVTLHPYQAAARVVRVPITLPASLASGTLRVVVSDGASLDKLMTGNGVSSHAVGLADTVAGMNRMHENDRVYVTLLAHTAQAVLETRALPEIPLSMANVLEPLKNDAGMQLTGESAVELGSAEAGYAVTGSHVLRLLVR